MKTAKSLYTALLHCYPAPFRQEYGHQMYVMFAQQLREARRARSLRGEAVLWAQAARDLLTIAPQEHLHVIVHDVRLAFRTIAAKPGFAFTAILSLALGIGANTAIFSLWHGVLFAPLPGVEDPKSLVILTRPSATGMWRGQWNGRTDGPRAWVTYAEFVLLRDSTPAFSSLMAAQSNLNTWQVRVEGGSPEEARGRLVSGGFFEVLGVRPAIGRLFSRVEDQGRPAYAVLSHSYWQRRFGGRPDALGKTLVIRGTPITIIGVAPAGFIGETSGQMPDFWSPILLQPLLLPGGDWLTERPPDKVMWLHVFGRLRPGVKEAEAETQANTVFQAALESSFSGSDTEGRRRLREQRLEMHSAARGASPTREQFAPSLTMLFVSAGILLLIACANLANLLLARSAARQSEIAVRVSLGASRGRLIRQLVTESLALAAVGGLAALAVAYCLHGLLVRMLNEADSRFAMNFAFDGTLLAFAVGVTLAAALAVGVFPAWLMSKTDPGRYLKENSRGTIGSSRELRSARWLVGLQLALSLPLLVGAGLLARTVYNLQNPELGFQPDRLLLARVDLGDVSEDAPRRDRALRELRGRFQRIPGVEAVSFSQLGLFTGYFSTTSIKIEGSALTAEQDVESNLDRVGTGYFTTLGIPLRLGRDISESDRGDSPLVCVVNEAFVRHYFDGRHPIGLHVTTVDEGERAYEVIGVAADARTRSLRDEVEPRFFVPSEQRPSSGTNRTFIIRTRNEAPFLATTVREATTEVDTALSVSGIVTIDQQMAPQTAEERAIARLALVFGTIALLLAGIGLYGVLSYGVSRRSDEIAIRIALGARSTRVVAMILRENLWLVAAGLLVGGVLAFFAPRLIASRLYGVSPVDPPTLVLATSVLLVVAFAAAYLPARRAARVDPMIALHQG